MRRAKLTVFAALIGAGLLAAGAVASPRTSTISLRSTAVGKVLVAANGHTLYLFTADKGKKSTCYGQCAGYWPPLFAAKPTAGAGVKASLLGTTKRKDGKLQVTSPATRSTSLPKTRRRDRSTARASSTSADPGGS